MSIVYDNWNQWYQNEKNNISKEFADFVIHPAGLEGKEEWEKTGLQNCNYTINELNLKSHETLLEYGCGNGRILKHFNKLHNSNAYGVDIVPQFVEEANSLGCDSYLLEDFNLKVDKVFSLTVFIHLRHLQARTALLYIYDHLHEGGYAYIQALIYGKDKQATNFSDMSCYKEETFRSLAEECGFEVIQLFTNEGDIDKEEYGKFHNKFQVLKKSFLHRN
tara:strand:+ start:2577 stop:3236 length:660 start_codon:yes stop_codon:yes gene_type:complete